MPRDPGSGLGSVCGLLAVLWASGVISGSAAPSGTYSQRGSSKQPTDQPRKDLSLARMPVDSLMTVGLWVGEYTEWAEVRLLSTHNGS